MKITINKYKFVMLFVILTIIALGALYSCSHEETKKSNKESQEKSFSVIAARDWYNTKFKESTEWKKNSESENMIPDWDNVISRKLDGLSVLEFPLVIKNTTNNTKKINNTLLKIGFFKISNDSIIVRKFYYVPESNYINNISYDKSKNKNNFIGLLITKKWNNELLSYKNIDDKIITELAIPKDLDSVKSNKSVTAKVASDDDPYAWYIQLGGCFIKGSQSKIDYWYYNYLTGKADLYKGSYYNTNTYQYNGYYYPLMSGSNANIAVTTAQSIENNIISSKLAPCSQKVLDKLKKSTDLDIATLFTAFGASTKFNITMISEEIKPDKNGNVPIATTERSTGLPAFNYTIKITTDYTTSTELFKATIIVHEMIHAYFISLLDNPSRDREFGLFQDYPLLFQTWVNRKYPGDTSDQHHEEMANT